MDKDERFDLLGIDRGLPPRVSTTEACRVLPDDGPRLSEPPSREISRAHQSPEPWFENDYVTVTRENGRLKSRVKVEPELAAFVEEHCFNYSNGQCDGFTRPDLNEMRSTFFCQGKCFILNGETCSIFEEECIPIAEKMENEPVLNCYRLHQEIMFLRVAGRVGFGYKVDKTGGGAICSECREHFFPNGRGSKLGICHRCFDEREKQKNRRKYEARKGKKKDVSIGECNGCKKEKKLFGRLQLCKLCRKERIKKQKAKSDQKRYLKKLEEQQNYDI